MIKIVFNTLPIPLAILAQSGNVLYYNPCYKKHWNISERNNELNISQRIDQDDFSKINISEHLAKSNYIKLHEKSLEYESPSKTVKTYSNWELIPFQFKEEKYYILYPADLQNNQRETPKINNLTDLEILAATVAHELRNPLGVIQLAALNIRRKRISPLIDVHIENIEKKIKESNSIITNILTFSRLPDPKYQKVNLFNLMNEVVLSFTELIKKNHITFKTQYDNLKRIMVELDPSQIKETLSNIILNAYQAVEPKIGLIQIQGYIDINKLVVIRIIDNGKGITTQNMMNIFKPFYSTKAKGIGLGLTLCKEFISRHKGQINIYSRPNRGTQVKISLPLRKDE